MRTRGAFLAFALLCGAASCERRLEGLACQDDKCLSGYTCCEGVCVSNPSRACIAASGGSAGDPAPSAGTDGTGRAGSWSEKSGGRGGSANAAGGVATFGGTSADGGSTPAPIPGAGAGGLSGTAGEASADGGAAAAGGEPADAGAPSDGGSSGQGAGGTGTPAAGSSGSSGQGSGGTGTPMAGASGSAGRGSDGTAEVVRMTHDAPTAQVGGLGGSLYTDLCPGDQALIGVQGNVLDGYLFALAAVCGHVRMNPPGTATAITKIEVDEGAVQPKRGVPSGAPVMSRCPADQVVVAFDKAYEVIDGIHRIRRLRLFCSPLTIGTENAELTIEAPSQNALEPLLDWPERTSTVGPISCITPAVGRGLLTRAGQWIDALQVACAVPIRALIDGSVCMRHEQCASGKCGECGDAGEGCERRCEPFQCVAPPGCQCAFFDSKHYLFCSEQRDHSAAQAFCSQQGGHLLYVNSAIENGWARNTASGTAAIAGEFWLGATDAAEENVFLWGDGTLVGELELWPAVRPAGDDLDCLQLNSDGQWQSGHCGAERPYVCELE